MLVWIAAFAACGQSPTTMQIAPEPAPARQEIVFVGASQDEETAGRSLWEEQKLCTGYDGSKTERLVIQTYPGGVPCDGGGDLRAGCWLGHEIRVGSPWYVQALAHELIHYDLWITGQDADFLHASPIWCGPSRCDWRNCTARGAVRPGLCGHGKPS